MSEARTSDERFVTSTEVERREDGLVLTFHCVDGSVIEKYVSPTEARSILNQIEAQLHD
jgi:hypothetical protein